MQPKTKAQKRIMELQSKLQPLTPAQEEWGKYLFSAKAYFDKEGNICAYCGKPMGKALKCPHCSRKHTARNNDNKKKCTRTSFNLCTSVEDWQVLRTFAVYTNYAKGKPCTKSVCEVCQSWIDAKGKEVRVARYKGLFASSFDWGSDMEIRSNYCGNGYSYYGDIHWDYQATYTYPKSGSLLSILKRNGIKSVADINRAKAHPINFITDILNNPKAETMLKLGYGHLIGERGIYTTYWDSLKIVMRHQYKIDDWHLWKDTIDLLEHFSMDIRNPIYICPNNLTTLHDMLSERKRREEEREERERERRWEQERIERAKKNAQAKANYVANKGMYFGICIADNELTIEVLKSVDEFKREGEKLNHCVYTNAYYGQENSLILSARINGESIETIEVDLTDFSILQCRGNHNGKSEHHNRIVSLMESNMDKIRAISRKRVAVA